MYKILIVDDEQVARQAIVQTVNWEEEGYNLMGEAKNGKEALEICETSLPDVILTDINMPYINGLELLEAVADFTPIPKVILLTAYDEFRYAQKAVKNKAADYILKPVTKDEILKILRDVKNQIDDERAKHEDFEKLKESFEKHLPLLKEKFLSALLTTQIDEDEIFKKADIYGIDIAYDEFNIAIIFIEDQKDFSDELRRFAVCNIAEEIMQEEDLGISFITTQYVVLFAMGRNLIKATKVFDKIQKSINKYLNFSISIGVGYLVHSPCDIYLSYKSAVTACNYKMLLGTNKVLSIDDLEPSGSEQQYFEEMDELRLATLIKTKDISAVNSEIDKQFLKIISNFKSKFEIYIIEMTISIFKTAKDSGLDTQELYKVNEDIFACIINMQDALYIRERIKAMCTYIIEKISDLRQTTTLQMIADTKQFIYENYQNPEVTIDKICNHLHVSISHFCALFKKETNDTFMNFLNVYRMEKAKDLLITTDKKITEIAREVGYMDPNYFSFSFKKMFNLSPREFKKSENEF